MGGYGLVFFQKKVILNLTNSMKVIILLLKFLLTKRIVVKHLFIGSCANFGLLVPYSSEHIGGFDLTAYFVD